MTTTCPSCGAKVPDVADAFCPECRSSLERPSRKHALSLPPEIGGSSPSAADAMTPGDWVLSLLLPPVGLIMGVLRVATRRPSGWRMIAAAVGMILFGLLLALATMPVHQR